MYNECSMSNENNSPIDLRDRTLVFSRDIIRFIKTLPKDLLTTPLLNQLIRSSTSVGANFIEAKNGSSKKDFRSKVFICKKEASETLYWLSLLDEFTDSKELSRLKKECQEIILILQKIINTINS